MGYYDRYYNDDIGFKRSNNSSRYGNYSRSYNLWEDDYYGYSKKSNKTIEKKSNNWDWYSSTKSYSYSREDDDQSLFTNDHENYITPKEIDIKSKFNCLLQSDDINLLKDLSRLFYYQMIENNNYMQLESEISESNLPNYQSRRDILNSLWDKEIPGYTPLEKAVNVYLEIQSNSGGQQLSNLSKSELEQKMSQVNIPKESWEDPSLNKQLQQFKFGKQFKSQILKKISLVSKLGAKFKVEKEVEEKIVNNSVITKNTRMKDYEQIQFIDLYQRVLPNFNIKFATKDLNVKLPVDRSDHTQKIIILVDESGKNNNLLILNFSYYH